MVGMDEKEDTFLINAALGTDLLTSAASATGDDDKPPKFGCLAVVIAAVALAWLI